MKNFIQFSLMLVLMLQFSNCTNHSTKQENEIIANKWQALQINGKHCKPLTKAVY
jgi:hypothetical protein